MLSHLRLVLLQNKKFLAPFFLVIFLPSLILVLRLANILTKSFNLFQYRSGGGGPYERPGVGIGVLDEMVDLADQVFHASECAPADGLLSDNIEPYLHLVQPGSIGRRKMNLKARMSGQPALNPRMLLGAIVVDHQMDG